jgi:hypothetical protein
LPSVCYCHIFVFCCSCAQNKIEQLQLDVKSLGPILKLLERSVTVTYSQLPVSYCQLLWVIYAVGYLAKRSGCFRCRLSNI